MIPMGEEERSAIQRGVKTWLSNHGTEPTSYSVRSLMRLACILPL